MREAHRTHLSHRGSPFWGTCCSAPLIRGRKSHLCPAAHFDLTLRKFTTLSTSTAVMVALTKENAAVVQIAAWQDGAGPYPIRTRKWSWSRLRMRDRVRKFTDMKHIISKSRAGQKTI